VKAVLLCCYGSKGLAIVGDYRQIIKTQLPMPPLTGMADAFSNSKEFEAEVAELHKSSFTFDGIDKK
jgi:hypothetical protein